jgi:hypothetical protein
MRIHRTMLLGSLSTALVMSIACSSSSSSSSSGSPETAAAAPASAAAPAAKPAAVPHACDLLKTEDAQAVLGPAGMVKRAGEVNCDLTTPNPLGPSIEVKIQPLSDEWDGGETMMMLDKQAKKVPDIGDGGYTFGGGTIVFKKGAFEVSVITSVYKGDMSKYDAARLIAERLATRL